MILIVFKVLIQINMHYNTNIFFWFKSQDSYYTTRYNPNTVNNHEIQKIWRYSVYNDLSIDICSYKKDEFSDKYCCQVMMLLMKYLLEYIEK